MLEYKFVTHISDLRDKKIITLEEINFSGEIRFIAVTEDSYVFAKKYQAASDYGVEYVYEHTFTSIEELFEDVDHEIIGILITEDEYKALTIKEEEKYKREELEREARMKQRKYEDYLKLKEEFEVNYKLD